MILILTIGLLSPDSIFTLVQKRGSVIPALKGRIEVIVEYPRLESLVGRFYLKDNRLLIRFQSPYGQDILITDSLLIVYNPDRREKIVREDLSPSGQFIPYLDAGPGILAWSKDWNLRTISRDSILGYDLYVLEGENPDTGGSHTRTIFWVDADVFLIRRVEFYGQDTVLNFIYLVDETEEIGETMIPTRYQMRILTRFGVAVFHYKLSEIKTGLELPDSLFRIGD
ncbi:MAG TPA: outer membrane lipoprotein-sorting protein [bacterium (Candidatus Stahlbacteria)]|nr:outer membrane lipoprotein-sorting protein [Candidatus Stahlbacteria bacterium]